VGSGRAGESAADEAGRAALDSRAVPEAAQKNSAGKPDSDGSQGTLKLEPTVRQIVYTAEMRVRAKDVTTAADTAKGIVKAAQGYVASEESSADRGSSQATARIVFKIPTAQYDAVVARLGKELGTRELLRQNTEDVTEEVADVESRVKSAKSSLEALRALQGRAKTVGEVLSVERELSGRQADLESLQARQKSLASLTSAATLTLTVVAPTKSKAGPKEKERDGFLGGLAAGWNALKKAAVWALTVIGALLPFLVVAGVAWLAVVYGLRRFRGRRPRGPAAPPSAPTPETP
jgi:hypothetical protein